MLSNKLEDLARSVAAIAERMPVGRPVAASDLHCLECVQRLLVAHAEAAHELESLTVPLAARRAAAAAPDGGNVVDLDRFRDRRHAFSSGGGAP